MSHQVVEAQAAQAALRGTWPALGDSMRVSVVKPEPRRDAALRSVCFPTFHKRRPFVSERSRENPRRLVGAIGLEPTTPTMSRMWSCPGRQRLSALLWKRLGSDAAYLVCCLSNS